jgi:hypothetical protein
MYTSWQNLHDDGENYSKRSPYYIISNTVCAAGSEKSVGHEIHTDKWKFSLRVYVRVRGRRSRVLLQKYWTLQMKEGEQERMKERKDARKEIL